MGKIKTFGAIDERSLKQLERCMTAGEAEFGVLCADHHPGYSQPIGGGIAYEGYVSPSGVGYDIGCIAVGTPVVTADGYHVPIETVVPCHPALCWDGERTRVIEPLLGAVGHGRRATVVLQLENGRAVTLTGDHEVRTKLGWKRADKLFSGDRVACIPFLGLPHEEARGVLDVPEPTRVVELRERGLWPLRFEERRLSALLRLLGYVSGDGHLTSDGKNVSTYLFNKTDAQTVASDFESIGWTPRLYSRLRAGCTRPELHVRVGSVALHSLFAALGSPVGKKAWPLEPMEWLFSLPPWLRAQFLSGFASAGMSTPRLLDGRFVNLALKQAGTTTNAVAFVARLLGSLGFRASISESGPRRRDRVTHVVQIIGGEPEQSRFVEQVGFCFSVERRVAAARVLSVAWHRRAAVRQRESAVAAARARWQAGEHHSAIKSRVADEYGVTKAFVHHAIYSGRGAPRSAKGARFDADHSGEVVWSPVERIEAGPHARVFDVATADPAASFVAGGIVVHNCGNKAARTELTRADLKQLGGVEQIMREITRRISFGMGVAATERVDHPVLDEIRQADFTPQRKLAQLAESQLGTVGSGNHYVNVMEDEEGKIWLGVHFGSRGFGHKTASGFLALAQGLPFDAKAHEGEMDSPPVLFEADSELGESDIAAMEVAGRYAYAGRDVVVDKVLEILGTEAMHEVHNHHNFAWREEHFGRTYWVIRKGCTPARPGQEGFVGATMGDESVILEGVGGTEAEESLFSTVHGAGRVMSRTQAAGRVRRRKRYACRNRDCDRVFDIDGISSSAGVPKKGVCPDHPGAGVSKVWVEEQLKPGVVDWPAVQARLREQGIVLLGGGADEAPEVYKRLPEVLAAHAGSIRVKHTLRPLGVAMAGRDIYDPYKD